MSFDSESSGRFVVICRHCDGEFYAQRGWTGREVQCPICAGQMCVPQPAADGSPVPADPPRLRPRHAFNFACPRCESLLESHTGMSDQIGNCPSCAARFVIPQLDAGGQPRCAELLDDLPEQRAPLHAYAASGHQAPKICRCMDGTQAIQCPRCGALSDIRADSCSRCNAPFSAEGVPTVSRSAAGPLATGSLIMSVVALLLGVAASPGVVVLVAAPLAVLLGLASWFRAATDRPSVVAGIGLALGVVAMAAAIIRITMKV